METGGQSGRKDKGKIRVDDREGTEAGRKEEEAGELPRGWTAVTPDVLSPATELLYQEWDGPEPYHLVLLTFGCIKIFLVLEYQIFLVSRERIFLSLLGPTVIFLAVLGSLSWTRVLTMILVGQA